MNELIYGGIAIATAVAVGFWAYVVIKITEIEAQVKIMRKNYLEILRATVDGTQAAFDGWKEAINGWDETLEQLKQERME